MKLVEAEMQAPITDKHASRSGFTPLKTATALKLMTTVSRKSEVATTSTSSTTLRVCMSRLWLLGTARFSQNTSPGSGAISTIHTPEVSAEVCRKPVPRCLGSRIRSRAMYASKTGGR